MKNNKCGMKSGKILDKNASFPTVPDKLVKGKKLISFEIKIHISKPYFIKQP